MPTHLFLTIVLLMPVIAIGINTAQFAPKYDREPWNARSWTLRDTGMASREEWRMHRRYP